MNNAYNVNRFQRRKDHWSLALACVSFISCFIYNTSSFVIIYPDLSRQVFTGRNVFTRQRSVSSRINSRHLIRAQSNRKPLDVEDVPDDWSEEDILAEFEGDVVADDEDDVESDEVDSDLVSMDHSKSENTESNDDDEDDLDLEAIDLDEDDEEDDDALVEETMGEYKDSASWDDSDSDNKNMSENDIILWDPAEDGIDYELIDDISDPNYIAQRRVVDDAIEASNRRASEENFDEFEYVQSSEFRSELEDGLKNSPLMKAFEERTRNNMISEMDFEGIDFEKEYSVVSHLDDDDYARHDHDEVNFLEYQTGLTDDDMVELDRTYKATRETTTSEPWDKVMVASMNGLDGLSNNTIAELECCLEEIGGSAYNITKWLLYDLAFNVSNLILASVKHNPDAPILFQHWYPQLVTYDRYKSSRDRNFDFTWDDVQNADISELERYYAGFGYDSIPNKAPAETGIISLEDLDEEEIKMAAFENWMTEVYNPEVDRKDFDDDTLRDEDNVFSDYYEAPQHPDLPSFEDAVEDLEEWKTELGDAAESDDPLIKSYRDMMGRSFDYTFVKDVDFERDFRGHLVVACTGYDADLEIAERITKRFEQEFGKKVYVETRVMALAREEDNVFEIWLESYEIDLLHSKKRAISNAKGWDGPAIVDDRQIEHLVDRVRFLISDDARYSYRWDLEYAD